MTTARTKACQWTCTRARYLKAQMVERRVARKNMMKQMVYARIATRAAGQVKKEEGDGVVATSKYCTKAIEDEEVNEDEDEEEDNGVGTEAQGDGDDLDAFEALFRPLSSSPTLRFVANRRSRSPFPPSLSLLSPISTPGPSTPDPLVPEPRLEVEPGYGNARALPSSTTSCASSRFSTSSTPATPTTLQGLTFPFPGIETADDAEAAPVTSRLHLRPNPRPRIRFRTLSASITARSPLSLSFPLSLSLPLSTRRVYNSGAEMNRYMDEQGKLGEDGVMQHGRAGRDVTEAAAPGGEEDRVRIGSGEDPFGTHGRAYYAPHARAALGFGDAYDMSAWTWACDYPPYRRQKKHEVRHHVRTGSATIPAFAVAGANIGILVGGTGSGSGSGSGSVYSTPIYAASAPQLSCANFQDKEVEYLRAMAKAARARARARVERQPVPVRLGTLDPRGQDQQHTPGRRSGIRPLLLPQKLGLPGSGVPVPPREIDKANSTLLSGARGHRVTGWERDLERGVSGEGDGTEA